MRKIVSNLNKHLSLSLSPRERKRDGERERERERETGEGLMKMERKGEKGKDGASQSVGQEKSVYMKNEQGPTFPVP